MSKFLSGRQSKLYVGISSISDEKTVLQVTGKVGIGTTTGQHHSLYVNGSTNIDREILVGGGATVVGIASFQSDVFIDNNLTVQGITIESGGTDLDQLNVSGVSTFVGITTQQSTLFANQLSVAGISTFASAVDINADLDVDGHTELDNLNVSGVSTFTGAADFNGDVDIDGHTELDDVNVSGASTFTGAADFNGDIDVDGHTELDNLNVSGVSTFAGAIDANGDLDVDGHTELDNLNVSGVSTFAGAIDANGDLDVDGRTELDTTNISETLNVTGISTFASAVDINADLDVDGHTNLDNVSVSGVVTATTFVGDLTGVATTATQLETARDFSVTGDFVTAPAVSFDGTGAVALAATITADSITLGTYTSGDYVESITGTSNQITVTGGTGESSTPVLSFPNQVTLPQDLTVTRDVQITRNLNVDGNITVGGTSATIFAETLRVSDSDLVLGIRTDANGNDVSTDNTASHGGIAIASTEGSPLVTLVNPGAGETLPSTYKKIMWFKEGSFSGLGTDAWLINYAVGIGSTQFPIGTRLAAGSVQFTENDISVVRDINASGIITANSATFSGLSNNHVVIVGSNGELENDGNLTYDGAQLNVGTGVTVGETLFTKQLGVAGVSTFTGSIDANGDLDVDGVTELDITNISETLNVTGVSTFASDVDINASVTISTDLDVDGVTELDITNISETLNVTGVSTFASDVDINASVTISTDLDVDGHTELDNVNISGIVTAFELDVDGHTELDNVNISGVSTFIGSVDANAGADIFGLTELDDVNVSSAATIASLDVNKISPDGIDFGGAEFILRATGSGTWEWADIPGIFSVNNILNGFNVSKDSSIVGTAGSITQLDFRSDNLIVSADPQPNGIATIRLTSTPSFDSLSISGITTLAGITTQTSTLFAKQLEVAGVSTFTGDIDANGDLDVDGHTELDNLNVSGVSTFTGDIDANGNLDVDGHTELDDVNVSGVSTFGSNVDINADLDVDGRTELDITNISETLNVVGISTFASNVDINADLDVDGRTELDITNISETLNVTGISTFASAVDINADLDVDGRTELDTTNIADTLNVTGISTFASAVDINADLDVDGRTELDTTNISETLNVSGITTLASLGGITTTGGDLYVNDDIYFRGDLYQDNRLFTSGVGIGSTTINPESGEITSIARVGSGFTDINFVGTGLSITGYGSTIVVDFGNIAAGSGGATVSISTDQPGAGSTSTGDLWWDSTAGDLKIYYVDDDSAAWIDANGGSQALAIVSENSPTGYGITSSGTLWWDSTTGVLKVYYTDADSNQWVDANSGAYINYWLPTLFGDGTIGIHTLGPVGVGTTAKSDYDLYVEGNINFNGNLFQDESPFVASRWTAGEGDDIHRIDGQVGVGTTNPRYQLEVGAVGAGGTQLWVNGDARVTGILSVGQGTITLDPDSNMIKLGALSLHRDSSGDALLMHTSGGYAPFRASTFLIDAVPVIDNNRNISAGLGTFTNLTVSGNVSVGGTLTYEDVTNIDSIGIITARSGIEIGTGTSISSPSNNVLTLGTNDEERLRLTSDGKIGFNDCVYHGTAESTLTTTSPTAIHHDLSTSQYRTVEYVVSVTEGTTYHATKIIALQDGSDAYYTEYGTIFSNATGISTFDVDVDSGKLRLLAFPASTNSTNYKVSFTAFKA